MGTATPLIREVEPRDVRTIVQIEKESFADAWNVQMVEDEIYHELAHYWVLVFGGKVVGYVGIWLVAGEAQVNRVAVAKKFRGRGLGDYLVEGLVSRCRLLGADSITLEVRADNMPARRAYLYAGFKSEGIRPKYYSDGTDAVIMWIR